MLSKYSLSRLLILVLSLQLTASSWAVQIVPVAVRTARSPGGAASIGAIPSDLLQTMDGQLDTLLPNLGATLPQLATPDVDLTAPAAEFLARTAIETAQTGANPDNAVSARILAAALSDTKTRAKVVKKLREQGTLGEEIAEKLDIAGKNAEGSPLLKQLGEDLQVGVSGKLAARALDKLFDGAVGETAATAATPEEFASYAERRFAANRLLPGQHTAVIAGDQVGSRIRRHGLPGDAELNRRMELSPLTNAEREQVVIELFEKAGADRDQIKLQPIGRGRSNVYVVKKGKSDKVIVVGGHYDKVSRGHGTIDNWTGATLVVNLYQAMKDADTDATFVFIAFGREEEGLIGSREYLSDLPREARGKIDSMVNLDTLGVDGTFSWKNNSDREMLDLAMKTSKESGRKLEEVRLWGGDADSSSFRRYGIPAITLFGASQKVIFDIIHSANDTIKAFVFPHYKNAYLLTLAYLQKLDGTQVRGGWLSRLAAWLSQNLRFRTA